MCCLLCNGGKLLFLESSSSMRCLLCKGGKLLFLESPNLGGRFINCGFGKPLKWYIRSLGFSLSKIKLRLKYASQILKVELSWITFDFVFHLANVAASTDHWFFHYFIVKFLFIDFWYKVTRFFIIWNKNYIKSCPMPEAWVTNLPLILSFIWPTSPPAPIIGFLISS